MSDLLRGVVGKQVHCFPHSFSILFDPFLLGKRLCFDNHRLLEAGADKFLPRTSSSSVSVLAEVLPCLREMPEIKALVVFSGLGDYEFSDFEALLR